MLNDKKYYTPEDVDNMSDAQLADKTIWEDIRKSMAKWKEGNNNAEQVEEKPVCNR